MSVTMTMPCATATAAAAAAVCAPPPSLLAAATVSPSLNEFFTDLLRYYKQVEPPTLMQDNARLPVTSTATMMMASSSSNQKSTNHRWEQPIASSAVATADVAVAVPGRTSGSLPMCPQRKLSREDSVPTGRPTKNREISFSPNTHGKPPTQQDGRSRPTKRLSDSSRLAPPNIMSSMSPPTCPQRRLSGQRANSICSQSTTSTVSTMGSGASVVSNASTVSHSSNASTISVNTIDTYSTLSSNMSGPRQLSPEEQQRIKYNLRTNLHLKSQRRSSTGMDNSDYPPLIPKTQRRGSTGTSGVGEYTDMIFVPPTQKLSTIADCCSSGNNSVASTADVTNDSSVVSSTGTEPPPPPTASPPTSTFTPPPPLVPPRKCYTPPRPLDSKGAASLKVASSPSSTATTASISSTSSASRPLFMNKVFLVHESRD